MSLAVQALLRKRLEELEQRKFITRPYALFPEPMSVDLWQFHATGSQAKLKEHVKSDEDGGPDYPSHGLKIHLVPCH